MMSYEDRLDQIAALEDGWLDGEGKAATPAAIRAARVFGRLNTAVNWGTYPSEDGGVLLEWLDGGAHCSIEIHPNGETGEFFIFERP
jgi:hypothetical protein